MSTNYPAAKDTVGTSGSLPVEPSGTPLATSHIAAHQNVSDAVIALETKVGVDSSSDATTIDYKLKNAASVNPGHLHTVAAGLSDVNITSVADGNVLVYNAASSKWINNTTSAPDASTSVKGVTKMSVAPVTASSPIAVGDNDYRIVQYYAETGSANAYVITPSPSIGAYAAGQRLSFKATNANTAASTLNVNALGAKSIKMPSGADPLAGDIASGQIVSVEYDGTNFQMISPSALAMKVATAGTSGQLLQSQGSGFPTWISNPCLGVINDISGPNITPNCDNAYHTIATYALPAISTNQKIWIRTFISNADTHSGGTGKLKLQLNGTDVDVLSFSTTGAASSGYFDLLITCPTPASSQYFVGSHLIPQATALVPTAGAVAANVSAAFNLTIQGLMNVTGSPAMSGPWTVNVAIIEILQ